MSSHFRRPVHSILATAVSAAFMLSATSVAAQTPDYEAPRMVGTDNPDLNGIWQAVNSANWNVEPHAAAPAAFADLVGAIGAIPGGQGVVEGGLIPYQPWAEEQRNANFENRLNRPVDRQTNEATGDPEAKCYLPGVPRATYMPFPFQLVQTPNQILIAYEYANATRVIHMDRQPVSPAPSWMGWSLGRWDGDTLVVEVTDQNDQSWFDRSGNFHSEDMRVTERYTPIGPDHLIYEATIEDPNVFTRPWTIQMPLYRRVEPDVQILEFKCVEFVEEFMYGHIVNDSN